MSIYSPKSTSKKSKSLKNSDLKKSNKNISKSADKGQGKSFISRKDKGLEIVSLSSQHVSSKAPNADLKKLTSYKSQNKKVLKKETPKEPGVFEVLSNKFLSSLKSARNKISNLKLPSLDFKFPALDFEKILYFLRYPAAALFFVFCYFLTTKAYEYINQPSSQVASADYSEMSSILSSKKNTNIIIAKKAPRKASKKDLLPTFETLNLDKELFHSPLISSEIIDSENGQIVALTLNDYMQEMAENLLDKYKVPWGAIVALDPKTGKVLTLASRGGESEHELPIALRSGFPAASLFKIVTGAAVIESKGMDSESVINYRGGNYIVSKSNYLPDEKRDSRTMKLGRAMGKSVNPVFARLALNEINQDILSEYAKKFGFFDMESKSPDYILPLENSVYNYAEDDFELARTAAGFGDVFISPVHAALLSASIANDGIMMKPYIVDTIKTKEGKSIYQSSLKPWKRVVRADTAQELSKMLEKTVQSGTARKTFSSWKRSKKLKNILVSGKTGTLSGENPKGRYHWFVGTVPADAPEISIAALVVDPGGAKINGAGLARIFLEKYFLQKAKIEANDNIG